MGILGAATSGMVWLFACYLPFHKSIERLGASWSAQNMKPLTFREIVSNNPIFPLVMTFKFFPLTVVLSLCFFFMVMCRFFKNNCRIDWIEVFLFFWMGCGLLFLGHLSYAPTRYYLPLLPSIVIMAAILVSRWREPKRAIQRSMIGIPLFLAAFIATFAASFYIVLPMIDRFNPQLKAFLFLFPFSRAGDAAVSFILAMGVASTLAIADRRQQAGFSKAKV